MRSRRRFLKASGAHHCRHRLAIHSRDQLQRLFDPDHIDNALQGSRQLDPATFRTLLLMLYGAGLRFGEATALTLSDVDTAEAILTIRDTKFQKSRLVPVGPQRKLSGCPPLGSARQGGREECHVVPAR